jgi:hypothetical protein
MIAFHGIQSIQDQLVAQLEAHYKADEIIKGRYWEDGKGCAVGCCVHSNDHSQFPVLYGIPENIAYLMDGIFENLPNQEAKEFPLAVIKAIKTGADLSKVHNLFFVWMLTDKEEGVSRFNPSSAIQNVSNLHQKVANGEEVSAAARAAAWDAARAAAWGAAGDAAWAAAGVAARAAAWVAARAAAGDAAWDAAGAAAWRSQARKLIELVNYPHLISSTMCHET